MKALSKFSLYFIALSFLLTIGCQQQHDMEKLQSQVDAINDEMVKAIMTNDPDASLKLYVEDLVSLPSYQPMIKGMDGMKDQIRERENFFY